MSPSLLKILRCPETHQALKFADSILVDGINRKIISSEVKNRAGQIISGKIDGGLIREDGKALYPIRGTLPILLVDEAILLS